MVVYYLGRRSFTSKAGRECFLASLIVKTQVGWTGGGRNASTDCFIDESLFRSLDGLEPGAAVTCEVDLRGNITSIQLDTEYAPISLGCKLGM